MTASIDSIESFGLVDGPGIRTVIFFNGCKLRCKYCHNPEMWKMKELNVSSDELVAKILKNKPYFARNNGGVTFSGGEPLLQIDFLLDVCKKLKEHNIHIALDTAGVGIGRYKEILSLVDLVLLDIKHINEEGYEDITGFRMEEFWKFWDELKQSKVNVWIRQVIIPGVNDNEAYMRQLATFLKELPKIEKVEFLPFHKMGDEKYKKLGINNPYENKESMDKVRCEDLYKTFEKFYKSNNY